jgi:hypothetical protein
MLRASVVVFDLFEAMPQEEIERRFAHQRQREALQRKLREVKGQLGALKVESNENFIVEFIGLAAKMYSILMMMPNGGYTSIMKGKGVPKRVLKAMATHATYKEMVMEPWVSEVEFKAMRSRQHSIEMLVLKCKMLTAFNDKVHQHEQLKSRPLGHWRNVPAATPHSEASAGSGAASSSSGQ